MSEPTRAELKYQVERQREEITAINSVGKLLGSSTDPQEVWQLVAGYLRETFPLAVAALVVPDQQTVDVIRFANIADIDLEHVIRDIIATSVESLPSGSKLNTVTPKIHDALTNASEWAQAPIRQLRSSYTAPITKQDEIVGVLCLFSGKPEAFSTEDTHVVNIVADQLSSALNNAFLVDALRQANTLKQDLLMVISHELRTPLTSIKEGTSLLLDETLGPINPDQKDFLSTVDSNADRLSALVEKAVLSSQLVAGQILFKSELFDANETAQAAAGQLKRLADSKGVELKIECAPGKLNFTGDALRLKQALVQIIENAIHATQKGAVRVACSSDTDGISIAVEDSGSGIPEEKQKEIFNKFHMVGTIDERKTGGLGLGLFIAFQLIRAQEGRLEFESVEGKGSMFRIFLPLQG